MYVIQQVDEAEVVLLHTGYNYCTSMLLLCAVLYIHASNRNHVLVSFPFSSDASLPLRLSDWCLRQQPSAVRYSRLSSPHRKGGGWGAYIRIVLIRHCQSKRSLSSTAERFSPARRDSCKVSGAGVVYMGGRAVCPASSSMSLAPSCTSVVKMGCTCDR